MHLLDWQDYDEVTWERLVHRALAFGQAGRTWTRQAAGRSLGLLFFNPSLRTRTSMELAGVQLGAHVTTLNVGEGVWGFAWEEGKVMDGPEAEHIREAVGVLSRYYDALGVRLFASMKHYAQDRDEVLLRRFMAAASVPVINLESAFYHPCQALADAATLMQHFDGQVAGRRFILSWATHPKALPMAVPHSALLMAARLGMEVTIARPDTHPLDPGVMQLARSYAAQHGTTLTETTDLDQACDGAEVVYAKAWGGPLAYEDSAEEAATRHRLSHWRITAERMGRTRAGVLMHCLPVRRNVVVDDAVLDGPHTLHLTQAEFRLHAQKAILEYLWKL